MLFVVCGCTFMCFCITGFETFGPSFSWVSFLDDSFAFLLIYLLNLVNSAEVYLVKQLKSVGVAQNLNIIQNIVGIKNVNDDMLQWLYTMGVCICCIGLLF